MDSVLISFDISEDCFVSHLVKTCSVLFPFRCSTDNIIRLTFLFIHYTISMLVEHTHMLLIWFNLWINCPTLKIISISFCFSTHASTDCLKLVSGSLKHHRIVGRDLKILWFYDSMIVQLIFSVGVYSICAKSTWIL